MVMTNVVMMVLMLVLLCFADMMIIIMMVVHDDNNDCKVSTTKIMTIMTIQAGMQSTRNSRDFFNPVALQHQRYASLAGCLVDQYHDAK